MKQDDGHQERSDISSIHRARLAQFVGKTLKPTLALVGCAWVTGTGVLLAQSISVPNFSFESPTPPPGFPATPLVDSWQKTPEPDWYDPGEGGFAWDQLSGVFPNTPAGSGDHIANLVGNQAAYFFGLPTVGLSQELSANFTVGMSYTLTVGLVGGSNPPSDSSFQIGLYYVDGANGAVNVASSLISYNLVNFPTANLLVDFQVQTPVVQASDAWAGKAIGVSLVAMSGNGIGLWDADNVRVEAVPEPSTWALAALGASALGWVWQTRRRQN